MIRTAISFALGALAGLVIFGVFGFWPTTNLRTLLPHDTTADSFYKIRLSIFRELSGPYDMAMVGDSLTELGPWSEMFPGTRIANRGVSNDRAELIERRLDTVKSTGARKTFLMFGVNNLRIGTDVDGAFASYRRTVDQLAPTTCLFVQSTIPTRNSFANTRIVALNRRLRDLCSSTHECHYLDIDAKIAPTGALTAQDTPDGTHLYASAYSRWKDAIADEVRSPSCPKT